MSEDRPSNRMLADLSHGTPMPWHAQLQWVDLAVGQELHALGTTTACLHFPTTALVALTLPTPDRGEVSVALVGNDGCLGIGALLGHLPETARAVVVHPGGAWKLPAAALEVEGGDAEQVTRVVLGHLNALTQQMSQTALCQRFHSVEQRLCRWLLVAFDRVPGDALAVTLGDLSDRLDVPLDVLAGAVAQLSGAGALDCTPERLRLLDRPVLQARTCGCLEPAQSSRGM